MNELTFPESGLDRIFSNIAADGLELLGRSHKMVEPILLPEAPPFAEFAIDLHSRVMLPRLALPQHRVFASKCRQDVNMIRHDNEVRQEISISIAVMETVSDDFREFRTTQKTRAMTGIEFLMPPLREHLIESALLLRGKMDAQLLSPVRTLWVDSMTPEPLLAISLPASEDNCGHGVRRSPGDEAHCFRLIPMRKLAVDDEQVISPLEQAKLPFRSHEIIRLAKVFGHSSA
jgi:hypothetical protein